jgi:hypothetical protein
VTKPPFANVLTSKHADAYLGGDVMNLVRNQFLIVLANRLGGTIDIPVSEVDATGDFIMNVEIDQVQRVFKIRTEKKQ